MRNDQVSVRGDFRCAAATTQSTSHWSRVFSKSWAPPTRPTPTVAATAHHQNAAPSTPDWVAWNQSTLEKAVSLTSGHHPGQRLP